MTVHLNAAISAEIRSAVAGYSLYNGGPGVNYKGSKAAYVVNITVLDRSTMTYDPSTGLYIPTPLTEGLIVQRGLGDGPAGVWSGVSGFIDIVRDPKKILADDDFDPIANTIRAELSEECGLSQEDIEAITLHLGRRYEAPWPTGVLHVLPAVGVFVGSNKPTIQVDGNEVTAYAWKQLHHIARHDNLSSGYRESTLPSALLGLGLQEATVQRLFVAA